MDEVGSFDAKNRLSELLERAERGEEIVITRRGRPIAKLVPIEPAVDRERSRQAVRRIRELNKRIGGKFDWAEWKKYVNEGRP